MAGYHNYSMSNNAVEAYYTGEKPISKWKKSDIISEINQYRKEFDLPMIDITKLKKVSIKIMHKHFLRCSSWHHTSSHYNKTDFYSIDEEAIDSLSPDTINHLIEQTDLEKTEAKLEKQEERWECEYLVWGGTRKHPKAEAVISTGTIIGNWFHLDKGGKKLITANGFRKINRI